MDAGDMSSVNCVCVGIVSVLLGTSVCWVPASTSPGTSVNVSFPSHNSMGLKYSGAYEWASGCPQRFQDSGESRLWLFLSLSGLRHSKI